MIPKDYLERVYAGFLGMNAGIRLGAPVEDPAWTYERILATYGEITGYIKKYKNFAADDDVNGPVYLLRTLQDDARDKEMEPEHVANAWLNYAREGVGLYWWGGYGVSTANTVYLNLKMGIPAPQSGSMKQNGEVLAQQIGGQIFIDTWGLVTPCDPKRAADYAAKAASVSHDGEALNGARFISACISEAFHAKSIREIIAAGLSQIPQASLYCRVAEAVIKFHSENPDDFRACRSMLERDWGYDKYKGACHVIPNAGICVLAMLYGGGEFCRTIEIATMCGWDTDCNAGSTGSILGVFQSIRGIAPRYREPINDSVMLSGISGYLNILDIPTYAKELALFGYKLAGEMPPPELAAGFKEGEILFDFELPGSTHNFRLSDTFHFHMKHCDDKAYSGKGALEVVFDNIVRGKSTRIFYKPFYTREEFNDERYSPTFAPRAYAGQKMTMKLFLDQWQGYDTVGVAPYIRLAFSNKIISAGEIKPPNGEWSEVVFTLPDSEGALIDEVGIILQGYSPSKCCDFGRLIIDDFSICGGADYTIDFTRQRRNFNCVTPFSHNHGAWSIEEDKMQLMSCEYAQGFTGNYFAKDYSVTAEVIPQNGESHMLDVRAQGAMRGYSMGLCGKGKAAIYVNDFGLAMLAETDFAWEDNKKYIITAQAVGNVLTLAMDGKEILSVCDGRFAYGMFGASQLHMGRTLYGTFHFKSIEAGDK